MRDPRPGSTDRLLECVKSNYGRTGWGARLSERTGPGGTFHGLELAACLDRSGLEAAKKVLLASAPAYVHKCTREAKRTLFDAPVADDARALRKAPNQDSHR